MTRKKQGDAHLPKSGGHGNVDARDVGACVREIVGRPPRAHQ